MYLSWKVFYSAVLAGLVVSVVISIKMGFILEFPTPPIENIPDDVNKTYQAYN